MQHNWSSPDRARSDGTPLGSIIKTKQTNTHDIIDLGDGPQLTTNMEVVGIDRELRKH